MKKNDHPAPQGYCCLVLHAHLPYVRHPEYRDALEERWLFEAIMESYLPLLEVVRGWEREGVDYRLTLSLSPTLVAMLRDELLQNRFAAHLDRMVALAGLELDTTRSEPQYNQLAHFYHDRLLGLRWAYRELYRQDLVRAFADLGRRGRLELMTCTATHGFLPLMQHQPAAVLAQVRVAAEQFQQTFGYGAAGLWNAECGYYPGLDAHFAQGGFEYFFVDAHALTGASQPALRSVYAPVKCPGGPAAFGRDVLTSREVWSSRVGYPGDPHYREFYRDIGFDREQDYIAPFVHESGLRTATGLKYHRVTGPAVTLEEKQVYNPRAAADRAMVHGDDFYYKRLAQVSDLARTMDRPPLVVAPYDAELFGHWWFEGPLFLDRLMRRMAQPGSPVRPITPSGYLRTYPESQDFTPAYSSWGEGGYARVWLNQENEWIYPPLHRAADQMISLAQLCKGTRHALTRRMLNQMARELLLAQSSDWAFMIRMGTTAQYASERVKQHLQNFERLRVELEMGQVDLADLEQIERRYGIFPKLQFEVYT